MKIKKDRENKKQEQTIDAQTDVMEELDDETMSKVSGAGGSNPFDNASRIPLKEIPNGSRGNI